MSRSELTIEALASGDGWEARWYRDGNPLGPTIRVEGSDAAELRDLGRHFLELFEQRGRPLTQPAALAAWGRRLYDLWFGPAWEESPRGSGHQLVIRSREREVLNLPWELVELRRDLPLGCDAAWALLRTPLPELSPAAPLPPGPLRVLFLAADATDQSRLDFEREEDAILRVMAPLGAKVALHFAETGSFEELAQLVSEVQPHVVHLSSHGLVNQHGIGTFVFENEAGRSDVRTAEDLVAEVFRGSEVRCIFFNGCQTSQAAVAGLCQELVDAGIPLALGWAASVADDRATQFSEVFYKRIAAGESLPTAVAHARLALRRAGRTKLGQQEIQDATFALAQLYTSEPESALFDRSAPPTPYSGPRTEYCDLGDGIKGLREGFIGRRRQLQQVLPALRSGQTTVVVLTGIGGMGKSTFATRVANRLRTGGYRVLPVRTGEGRTPAERGRATLDKALAALSDAFESEGRPDLRERMAKGELSTEQRARLAVQGMNDLRLLLVLDNFEDGLETETRRIADPDLAAFYRALADLLTRGSRVLVTCRYLPADTPADRATLLHLDLPDLEPHDRRKLIRRDPAVEARISKGELTGELLQTLFGQIGGTPGFLELARSVPRTADLEALEEELSGRQPGELSEQRAAYLQKIFLERLYAALPPTAQDLASRLAVSELPLPLDAVAELCRLSEDLAQGALHSGINYGLVQRLSGADGSALYHPPGLLRLWLMEPNRLSADKVSDVHHLLAAFWRRSYETNRELELGLPGLTVLESCRIHARLAPSPEHYRWATVRLARVLHRAAEWRRSRELLEEIPENDRAVECLQTLARVVSDLGDWKAARSHLERVLSVCNNNPRTEASARHMLASIDLNEGNYATARENFGHALMMLQAIRDRAGEAATWHQLATIDVTEGNYAAARVSFGRALEMLQAIGDQAGKAAAWHNLASIDLNEGNYAAARENLSHALRMRQDIGDRAGEATTWHQLATIDLNEGNYVAARAGFRRSLQIKQTIGNRAGEATTWHQLATIDLNEGNYAAARAGFRHSLQIKQAIGDTAGEAASWYQLGFLLISTGRATDGARLVGLCWIIDQAIGHGDAPQDLQNFLGACAAAGLTEEQQVKSLLEETMAEYQQDRGAGLLERAFPEGWEAGITPSE